MKAKTTLTAKDIANIKNALESVCLDSNRANRKRMRELEREVKKLKEMPLIVKYLLGESHFHGVYFHDVKPDDRPMFWWRAELRKLYS